MDGELSTSGTGKQDVIVASLRLAQPGFQDSACGLGYGCTAFLAAFADDPGMSTSAEDEVVTFEPGHLG